MTLPVLAAPRQHFPRLSVSGDDCGSLALAAVRRYQLWGQVLAWSQKTDRILKEGRCRWSGYTYIYVCIIMYLP